MNHPSALSKSERVSRVFLCHNSKDKPLIEPMALALLKASALRTWLDRWEIRGGKDWEKQVKLEFAESWSCLVLLGPNGIGPYQSTEIDWAKERVGRDPEFLLIPVLLPGATTEVVEELGSLLPTIQRVDLRDGWEKGKGVEPLIKALRGDRPGPPALAISIAVAAEQWDVSQRSDSSGLLRGRNLANARVFLETAGTLDTLSLAFLTASTLAATKRSRNITLLSFALAAVFLSIAIWAVTESKVAKRQRQIAETNAQVATEQLANATTALGVASLGTDPARALNLARASAALTSNVQPAQLLRAAIRRNPVWTVLKPDGVSEGSRGLSPIYQNPTDAVLVTPRLDEVLMPERAGKDFHIGESGQSLVLRSVPSGQITARLQLQPHEYLISDDAETSNVAILRSGRGASWAVRVFLLGPKALDRPVWQASDVVSVATTSGKFPLYVLNTAGELIRIDCADASCSASQRILARQIRADYIKVHPTGKSLALMSSASITWMPLDEMAARLPASTFSVGIDVKQYAGAGTNSYVRVAWGPDPDEMLAYVVDLRKDGDHSAQIRLLAIAGSSGNIVPLKQFEGRRSQLNMFDEAFANLFRTDTVKDIGQIDLAPYFFKVTGAGTRVAIVQPDERFGTEVAVFDLVWHRDSGQLQVEIRAHEQNVLVSSKEPGQRRSVTALALTPDGKSAAVAIYRHTEDAEGGTIVDGVEKLEAWSLSQLESQRAAPTYNQLSADPIQPSLEDQKTYEVGMAAIVRLTYSEDGSRLAVVHENGAVDVFRVSGYGGIPEVWLRRLDTPSIAAMGPGSRFARVTYGDGQEQLFDLKKRAQLTFPDDPGDLKLLDSVWLSDRQVLATAVAHGIYLFGDTAPTRVVEFKEQPTSVRIGTYLTYVAAPSGVTFYKTAGWKPVGEWSPSPEQKTLYDALIAATEGGNASAQPTLEWAPVGADYSVVTDWNHEFQMWTLSPAADENGTVRIEAGKVRVPIPQADWVSVRRTTTEPALLWINTGNYRKEARNTVAELDLKTGQYVQQYRPCNGDWPKRIAEVAAAFDLHDEKYVVFRDWSSSSGTDTTTTYDIAKWPKGGGSCVSWVTVTPSRGSFEEGAEVNMGRKGKAVLRLDWWARRPSTGAVDGGIEKTVQGVQYVDVETGKTLAITEAPDDVRLFPYIEFDCGPKASTAQDNSFALLYRDVAARGFDYWSGITTEKLPAVMDPSERLKTVTR